MITSFNTQDTIKPKLVVHISTDKLLPDSVFQKLDLRSDSQHLAASARAKKAYMQPSVENEIIADTTAVCSRNSIVDVTFYDPLNFITQLDPSAVRSFPFLFTEKNNLRQQEAKTTLIKNLKEGQILPLKPIHSDWIVVVIFVAAFLFSLIKATSKSMLPEVTRFFLFRGINEPVSRDISGLFYWQSTILNLISFVILGLFSYCAAAWYDFIPTGISPILFMFISSAIIVSGITLRHFICRITGNLSGESEVFNEYLIGVYQSYRFCSLIIFVLVVLLVYTAFLPPDIYFFSGLVVLLIMYIYRVLRLFLIFIKKDISIFYLILYLCALEILPVLILLKYFTGLF